MKKKIVPLLLALVILFVLLAVLNPEFREKIRVVIDYISNWLGIEWGSIRGWRSAQLFLC
jgi:predicted PurR-regulated permease PerM